MTEPIPPPPPPPQALYALMQLLRLVGMIVALGLATAWGQTFGAFFDWLGGALNFKVFGVRPLGWLAKEMKNASSRVQNFFGNLALVREGGMTTFLTLAAKTQGAHGDELGAVAQDSYATIQRVQTVFVPWFVAHKTAPLTHSIGKAQTAAQTATKTSAHATAQARTASHAAAQAKPIARRTAIAVTQPLIGRLEHDVAKQKATLAKIAGLVTLAGFTGFMWRWLDRNGLRWLKCPSVSRIGSKIGCGGFGFLESLLADAFDAMVVLDLCRYATAAQRLAKTVAPELGAFLLVQHAICLGGGASLPSAHDSPKTTTHIALPSAHD